MAVCGDTHWFGARELKGKRFVEHFLKLRSVKASAPTTFSVVNYTSLPLTREMENFHLGIEKEIKREKEKGREREKAVNTEASHVIREF